MDFVSSIDLEAAVPARCEIDLSVGWHEVIDSDQPMVEVVTGPGATHLEPWNLSTDGVSTFYPGLLVGSFVQSLYRETSLIVRIVAAGNPPRTAAFDVEDIEQALVNVWAACGP